jgi:hypothetical protein
VLIYLIIKKNYSFIISFREIVFIEQMRSILEKTPEKVGKFHFDEFEVSAEITGKGSLAILGTGGGDRGDRRVSIRFSSYSMVILGQGGNYERHFCEQYSH